MKCTMDWALTSPIRSEGKAEAMVTSTERNLSKLDFDAIQISGKWQTQCSGNIPLQIAFIGGGFIGGIVNMVSTIVEMTLAKTMKSEMCTYLIKYAPTDMKKIW